MRIHHYDTDQVLNNIGIFLTPNEAERLIDELQSLLKNPDWHHFHFAGDDDGKAHKELMGTIYYDDNLNTFDARSKKLILEDK